MLAIVSALSHPSVNRLTETWSRINAKDRKTFENLQKFAPEQEGRQLLQSIFQQIKVCNKVLRNQLRNAVMKNELTIFLVTMYTSFGTYSS